jgi:hypothetical protein
MPTNYLAWSKNILHSDGYTISAGRANALGLLFVLPVALLCGVPFVLIGYSGLEATEVFAAIIHQNKDVLAKAIDMKWCLFAFVLLSVVLHELIHGIFMAICASKGWKSVSFGFNRKALAPYAHCKEPLTPCKYRISLIMPALLLGALPTLISWRTGNILLLFYGMLFLWTAAGDFIILFLSRKIKTGMLQDHSEKIGFTHIN